MHAGFAFVFGIVAASIVLLVTRKSVPSLPQKPTLIGWLTFVCGLIASAILAATLSRSVTAGMFGYLASISLGFAAVVLGIGALVRHDRHWPTWVGFILGLLPSIFWFVFAAGYVVTGA